MIELLAMNRSASAKLYVDDVFSAYMRTGTGASATITTGNDISGKGGLVIVKSRSAATDWKFTDTARGVQKALISNSTAAESTDANGITAFGSTGHTVGTDTNYNNSGATYIDYEFCKAPKFFDVVTYTGNGSSTQTINHNLGSVPGCIIIKVTSQADDWYVYHRSLSQSSGVPYWLNLNTTAAETFFGGGIMLNATPTSTSFTVKGGVNGNGNTYVAYLFAHDTTTDGIIQCGSFTTDGSGNATVNLGWEPQWLLWKPSDGTGNWQISDGMRGFLATGNTSARLFPNTSDAEVSASSSNNLNATGFSFTGTTASRAFIYLAIRRPNKPPTTGTQVFSPNAVSTDATAATTNFPVDLLIEANRAGFANNSIAFSRLTGGGQALVTASTAAEFAAGGGAKFESNTSITPNVLGTASIILWNFRRAPGVFDIVCYTGTGSNKTETHNLTVAPEFWIIKGRSGATAWAAGCTALANTEYLVPNTTAAKATGATYWNSTFPTSTVFSIGTSGDVNTSTATYVAYLFATKAGISKVGSFTGNGSNQTIDCGFSAGARFVLIKRTDSTGDWYIWDTVRGIVAGNDPHLSLNTTAAEVTTDDSIDTASSGFIVNQDAATNINVNTATYIFLAFA